MSAETGRLDDAVAALMRKSRISAITTALIAVGLGLGFAFLSYEVYEKRQEYDLLTKQEADLEQQIAAKKQELADATAAAAKTSVAAFKAQLTAAATDATPDARVALASVIARAQIAQQASGAGRLVYLQYNDPATKPAMQQLQAALSAQSFVAPGVELTDAVHFDPKTPNMVKYFQPQDADIAANIARIAVATLAKTCPGVGLIPAVPVSLLEPASATQFEVWIGTPCGPAVKRPGAAGVRQLVTPQPIRPVPAKPR
jgi:hypothetical protein